MTFYKLAQEKQYVDATTEPDPEEPATVPIRTALEGATDTEFTVKGVVTLVDGQNYYLQDATGGICLRLAAKTDEIALGDTIIAPASGPSSGAWRSWAAAPSSSPAA